MTRKQYISNLRKRLCFLLPDNEISDIICDIEECFDAGINEGKSEDEICLDLGEPKTAAKEIIEEHRKKTGILNSMFGEKYISAPLCVALAALVYLCASPEMSVVILIIISLMTPPLIHLILERDNLKIALKTEKNEAYSMFAAAFLFGAVLLFRPFSSVILFSDGSAIIPLSIKLSALITAPQILLIFSIVKSGKSKLLCIVPIFITGMTAFAEINASRELAEESFGASAYQAYFGGALNNTYSILLLITAAELLLWEIFSRNAFAVPTLYMAFFGGIITKYTRWELGMIDPTDKRSVFLHTDTIILFAAVGTAAALISLAVIISIRQKPKAQPPKQHMEINSAVQ